MTTILWATDVPTLDKHFRYDYCTTCHSAQAASIDGKIVIHEWEKSHLVTLEWLWCALTRSTDLNNVVFCENAEAENELNEPSPGLMHRVKEEQGQLPLPTLPASADGSVVASLLSTQKLGQRLTV